MNWLLLRGLSREKRHWGTFPDLLAEASGDTVHCLDLPGFGSETGRPSPITVRGIAEDLRGRWLPLKTQHPGPWGLLGISLGGMVTMQWAGDHPDDFERVVIVNSSAGNLSLPWQRMQWGVVPGVVRSLFDEDDVQRERRILGLTTRMAGDLDTLAREWAAYAQEARPERMAVVRQLLAAIRFRAPAKLRMPVLVVSGGQDPLTAPVCEQQLAAHFQADFERHPDGGHELALDVGPWLATRVAAWAHPGRVRVAG